MNALRSTETSFSSFSSMSKASKITDMGIIFRGIKVADVVRLVALVVQIVPVSSTTKMEVWMTPCT